MPVPPTDPSEPSVYRPALKAFPSAYVSGTRMALGSANGNATEIEEVTVYDVFEVGKAIYEIILGTAGSMYGCEMPRMARPNEINDLRDFDVRIYQGDKLQATLHVSLLAYSRDRTVYLKDENKVYQKTKARIIPFRYTTSMGWPSGSYTVAEAQIMAGIIAKLTEAGNLINARFANQIIGLMQAE